MTSRLCSEKSKKMWKDGVFEHIRATARERGRLGGHATASSRGHSSPHYANLSYDQKAEYCLFLIRNPGATEASALAHAAMIGGADASAS